MAKKDLGAGISKSIKAETQKVQDRFALAEQLLEPESIPEQSEPEKPKKQKRRVIRDSFTLPVDDYQLITTIRERCLDSRVTINKSEVIRAGLHALNEMSETELLAVVDSLTKIKTGRPGKSEG
jgi:hypothetical protein